MYKRQVLDLCFAVLAFLVIETLHTQISSLFLGKDGTAFAYQVSGDYMRWIGSVSYTHLDVYKRQQYGRRLYVGIRDLRSF